MGVLRSCFPSIISKCLRELLWFKGAGNFETMVGAGGEKRTDDDGTFSVGKVAASFA